MNKYQRQSQKTNLWARRRNKTAELLLDGQLRYLEKRCKQGMKQHLNGAIRLEEDLREMVRITERSREDMAHNTLKLSENGRQYDKSNRDFTGTFKTGPISTSSVIKTDKCHSNSTAHVKLSLNCGKGEIGINTDAGNANQVSKKRMSSNSVEVNNDMVSDRETVDIISSYNGRFDLKVWDISNSDFNLSSNHQKEIGFSPFTKSTQRSVTEVDPHQNYEKTCRFNRDGRLLTSSCKHFPCYIPSTYHALGFRRDDASTWSSSKYRPGIFNNLHAIDIDSNFTGNEQRSLTHPGENSSTLLKLGKFVRKADSNSSMSPRGTLNGFDEEEDNVDEISRPLYPRWMSGHETKKFSFRPVSGPSFGPKPQDPILERVRQGIPHKPTKLLDRQPARMTVAGRMRGLSSLISEMREKHEQARPVDWAVNYGQRLPMRVLLTPAVPVGVV